MNSKEEKDTVRLLRKCDAGIKMGIGTINNVIPRAGDAELEDVLRKSAREHEKLRAESEQLLNSWGRAGRNPSAMAKAMSVMKTDMTLKNGNEHDAAELISNGCYMGIDKLKQNMDKYTAADGGSRKLTRDLISIEQKLMTDLQKYL